MDSRFRGSDDLGNCRRMNILITGASRGIGGAAYTLLRKHGHSVVGHSSRGSDDLIAGDLTSPAAPRNIWDTAVDELGGEIHVLVNNAGIYEAVADNATDEEWHAAWRRTLTISKPLHRTRLPSPGPESSSTMRTRRPL